MRFAWLFLPALLVGCSSDDWKSLAISTPLSLVQQRVGGPDLISHEEDGQDEFFVAGDPQIRQLPPDVPQTHYYLARNRAIIYTSGQVVTIEPIPPGLRDQLLHLQRQGSNAREKPVRSSFN